MQSFAMGWVFLDHHFIFIYVFTYHKIFHLSLYLLNIISCKYYKNLVKKQVVLNKNASLKKFLPHCIVWLLLSCNFVSMASVVKFFLTIINSQCIFDRRSILERKKETFTDFQTEHPKMAKSDIQSQFSMSKIIWIFLNMYYFHYKN